MHFTSIFTVLSVPVMVLATLDPATSNTKGSCPSTYNCSGEYPHPKARTNRTNVPDKRDKGRLVRDDGADRSGPNSFQGLQVHPGG